MATWQLQEAKNRFSALINQALTHGPQFVTRHGQKAVVVMAAADYERSLHPRPDLISFLRSMPLADLDLERVPAQAREEGGGDPDE